MITWKAPYADPSLPFWPHFLILSPGFLHSSHTALWTHCIFLPQGLYMHRFFFLDALLQIPTWLTSSLIYIFAQVLPSQWSLSYLSRLMCWKSQTFRSLLPTSLLPVFIFSYRTYPSLTHYILYLCFKSISLSSHYNIHSKRNLHTYKFININSKRQRFYLCSLI